MTNQDLQRRIESSPKLKALAEQLQNVTAFYADSSVTFDPMLAIMIISIIVQVVIHCREKRTPEELIQDIRDIRTLPPRRLMRLRRRANVLWNNIAPDTKHSATQPNPILTALYELGESTDTATLAELIALAE
jgi:hypothetical protein